jgi:hypothetical protein
MCKVLSQIVVFVACFFDLLKCLEANIGEDYKGFCGDFMEILRYPHLNIKHKRSRFLVPGFI